jgi:serine/threonine-protein kinase
MSGKPPPRIGEKDEPSEGHVLVSGTPQSSDPPPSGEQTRTGPSNRKASARPPEPPLLHEGDLIAGKYVLETKLGEGGMGSVWVARHEALDIQVAIKVIRADVRKIRAARSTERLLQEARAAARLGHPAIVRISDFGLTDDGDPFLVMELLDGEDLASALDRRGRVSPIKAVRMLLPIAHALLVAHQKHIVHRDIKPENIFLVRNEDGTLQPKLIDFGVAKIAERKAAERLTNVGAVMGSPGYMSPEQARGFDADERADIWSLCIVLYEMITDRLPFDGKNYNSLMRSIIEDEVASILSFGVGDEALWKIIERGLAKAPEARWSSMRELGNELADWLLTHGIREDICGHSIAGQWSRALRSSHEDLFDSDIPPPRLPLDSASPGFELGVAPFSSRPSSSSPHPSVSSARPPVSSVRPPMSSAPMNTPPEGSPRVSGVAHQTIPFVQPARTLPPPSRRWPWVLLVAVLGAAAIAVWWQLKGQQPKEPPPAPALAAPSLPTTPEPSTQEPSASETAAPSVPTAEPSPPASSAPMAPAPALKPRFAPPPAKDAPKLQRPTF